MQFAIVLTAVWFLSFAPSAYAYLDPGTGAMLVQLILGGVAGVAVIAKLYWRRFLNLIRPAKTAQGKKS